MLFEWGKSIEPIRGHLVAQDLVRVDRAEHGDARACPVLPRKIDHTRKPSISA
jgi:hypothetical protein